MAYCITVLPQKLNITAAGGERLMDVLRSWGLIIDAPCGGSGTCGKCRVTVDGQTVLACRTVVDRDMTVVLHVGDAAVLTDGVSVSVAGEDGRCLAFDIGTTTVAGFLLDGKTGQILSSEGCQNPQCAYGADVVTRISCALKGDRDALTESIRNCVHTMAVQLCRDTGTDPLQIRHVSVVGNPAMRQLFLGLPVDNLASPPFAPVLTAGLDGQVDILPGFHSSRLLTPPDISGYVGADTLACVLTTGLHEAEELTLLVDIGTNGELVLGDRRQMVCCSTAAGPALEGANITFGMRAQVGAIDRVWAEGEGFGCSVIGGGDAKGICGTGLIDAVAAALDMGLLNERGRILNESRRLYLTKDIYLTQADIRQLQTAKGAIAAGIQCLCGQLGVEMGDIQKVYMAGAFGSFLNPASACRIGLLPPALMDKMAVCGNAAGSGACRLAVDPQLLGQLRHLAQRIVPVELGAYPDFQRSFAHHSHLMTSVDYWKAVALATGFDHAASLDVTTLQPREDVRAMCAADKCGAYGRNHTCPPACGTLSECDQRMAGYSRGILVQTVGWLQKTIDTKGYRRAEQQHLAQFAALCEAVRARHPHALCLGTGGCRVCRKCSYPEPCRFPEKAVSSMEAYGLFVTQVCRDNGLCYHHGEKTVTYTACILF